MLEDQVLEYRGRPLGRLHFVGIGGAGMSAIALVAMELGARVTGSDIAVSDNTERLARRGAGVFLGHAASHVGDVDAVIVSSAIAGDNPEVAEARRRGIPVLHRAEMLAAIMRRKKGIAVAGTHGKTTTTSMLAVVFERTGCKPTWIVGGMVRDLGSGAGYGTGPYLIAEADESDESFLTLDPYVTVVTNIDNDHLDHYGSLERIVQAFKSFLARTRADGFAVLCRDDPNLAPLAQELPRPVTYSLGPGGGTPWPHYQAVDVRLEGWGSRFTVRRSGEAVGEFRLGVPGRHNVANATAVVAVATELGLPVDGVAAALAGFKGAGRRLQVTGRSAGVEVLDDYAHHPTEIAATLKAARALVPGGRLVVVFQPHRFTRTRDLYREFGRAFAEADVLILTDIYPASEPPIPGVSGELIYRNLEVRPGQETAYVPALADVAPLVASRVRPGDLVLTMGAGDVNKVGPALLALLDGLGRQSWSEAAAGLTAESTGGGRPEPEPGKRPGR